MFSRRQNIQQLENVVHLEIQFQHLGKGYKYLKIAYLKYSILTI